MSEALQKKSTQLEIAELISRGELSSADEISDMYGVSFQQAVSLLGNSNFIALVQGISKARATLAWHSKVIPKVIQMLDNPDPKIQIQAMKLLGQITDSVKGGDFNININLENLVRQFTDSDEKSKASNNLNKTAIDAEYERVMAEKD